MSVAYVDIDGMCTWAQEQRYTRLEQNPEHRLYKHESLDGGFTADLLLDADGLVLDYPGLVRRVI
jgi:uncharacterized protein